MSANVETMMYVREKPWHGLGTRVEEAPTSVDALRLAGLDWTVERHDVHLPTGAIIPNYKANVRSNDGSVLGVVSDQYKIVQNADAFAFTDALIGGETPVRYDTAGSLRGGRKIWLLAKLPDTEIVGDKTEPYLCFSNTHDGSGAIRVCMTPVRVVCNNTLNIALNGAKRSWSVRHTGDIQAKLHEARMCLDMANKYMDRLGEYADQLANQTVKDEEIAKILDEMFPVTEDSSDREKKNAEKARTEYMICYFAPDIAKFKGTAWGALNAMSDMVGHNAPRRQTANYRENNWGRIMDGHAMLDKMASLLVGASAK
jgi:phage/plasmid-like protein (TIGR03299 family)